MQARIELTSGNEVDFSDKIANAFHCAVQEALKYIGRTAPNPPVGCAILDQHGNILTIAAHHQVGELHAEALALKQCRDMGVWDQIAEIVVTLEPCNHTGRTPPCSDAILKSPAKRIWIGVADPNPHVNGAGGVRLQQGGREVVFIDQLQSLNAHYWAKQCRDLLAPFTKFVTQHKAWITVKQALTVDGSMYPPKGQKTFTSSHSLRLAHQLRRGTEAVITGMNTIKADLPSFTVRHIQDHPNKKRLLVICTHQEGDIAEYLPERYLEQAKNNGFSVVVCPDLQQLPSLLAEHHVMWAMVEAGPKLLQEMKQAQIWDEWLTIRQQPQGEDDVTVVSQHSEYPTTQLLSDLYYEIIKEEPCSLVS